MRVLNSSFYEGFYNTRNHCDSGYEFNAKRAIFLSAKGRVFRLVAHLDFKDKLRSVDSSNLERPFPYLRAGFPRLFSIACSQDLGLFAEFAGNTNQITRISTS